MLAEAVQLETLRQRIEDAESEAGSQSDYLDRGKPDAGQAKKARETIDSLSRQSREWKEELKQLIVSVRTHRPQALEEWINFHTGILQEIAKEKETDLKAITRRNVAKGTLQDWEKVRAGEQEYVGINGYYLKDYKDRVRTLLDPRLTKSGDRSWWQFWK